MSVGHSKSQYRVFVLFYFVWIHICSVWAHIWSVWAPIWSILDQAYSILLHFYSKNVLRRGQISIGFLSILFSIFITCMPNLIHFVPFLVVLDPIITLFLSKIASFWSQNILIIDIDGFRAFWTKFTPLNRKNIDLNEILPQFWWHFTTSNSNFSKNFIDNPINHFTHCF